MFYHFAFTTLSIETAQFFNDEIMFLMQIAVITTKDCPLKSLLCVLRTERFDILIDIVRIGTLLIVFKLVSLKNVKALYVIEWFWSQCSKIMQINLT